MDSIDLVIPKPLWLVPISHDLCVRDDRRQHALVLEPVDILCLPLVVATNILGPGVVYVGADAVDGDDTAIAS